MKHILEQATENIVNDFQCHTVLLYGSRSLNLHSPYSDYDIAGFNSGTDQFHIGGHIDGQLLDVWIYPDRTIDNLASEQRKLRGAQILYQQHDFGDRLLAKLDSVFSVEKTPMSDEERGHWAFWLDKMAQRIHDDSSAGHYRRFELLIHGIQIYFEQHNLWFEGIHKALVWLEQHDKAMYHCYIAALEQPHDIERLNAFIKQLR